MRVGDESRAGCRTDRGRGGIRSELKKKTTAMQKTTQARRGTRDADVKKQTLRVAFGCCRLLLRSAVVVVVVVGEDRMGGSVAGQGRPGRKRTDRRGVRRRPSWRVPLAESSSSRAHRR
jgi:hypothetical protein